MIRAQLLSLQTLSPAAIAGANTEGDDSVVLEKDRAANEMADAGDAKAKLSGAILAAEQVNSWYISMYGDELSSMYIVYKLCAGSQHS